MDFNDFKDAVLINKHELDREFVEQSQTFFTISDYYAKAVSKRDALKEDVTRAKARAAMALREDAETTGKKITETAILQMIEIDEKHMEAMDAYLASCKEVNRWQALKDAFNQRSFMLRDLASLFLANYYAADSATSKARSDVATADIGKNRAAINEKRQRLVRSGDDD